MYTIVAPEAFLRQARKFFRKHPELKPGFGRLLADLQADPFQPHLKLHALTGKLAGLYAVRLNFSYRVTLTLMLSEKEIVLLDIGSHDDVYR